MMGEPLAGAFPRVGGCHSLGPEEAGPSRSIVRDGMKFRGGGGFGDNTLPGACSSVMLAHRESGKRAPDVGTIVGTGTVR